MHTLDLQGLLAGQDGLGLGLKFPLPLPLEPVEAAGEIAGDYVELTVAIPIDREGPGADFLGQFGLIVRGDNQRFAVRPLQFLGLGEAAPLLAAQNLEQARHILFHPGVGSGENVTSTVPIDIHKLWSGGGASPYTGYFGVDLFSLQPGPLAEIEPALVGQHLDLALGELANQ